MLKKIISNRNMLLVAAVLLGIFLPKFAPILKHYTMVILAIVMTMSLTAISLKSLTPIKSIIKPFFKGILLNHIIFGFFIGIASLFFIDDKELFYGFIIIIATPPGVAIIPFTSKLNGNMQLASVGTFGAFFASIILAPLILAFLGESVVSPTAILKLMLLLIALPFAISRLLSIKQLLPLAQKTRGYFIDIGFSLIIYISVGLNSHVFFSNLPLVLSIFLVFFVIMYLITKSYGHIVRNKLPKEDIISQQLLFSIKSSGFAVVTAIDLFGVRAAIPATIMSVAVLIYLLYLLFSQKSIQN